MRYIRLLFVEHLYGKDSVDRLLYLFLVECGKIRVAERGSNLVFASNRADVGKNEDFYERILTHTCEA